MSINSILFAANSSLREPALLNLDKSQNYDSLASLLANEETAPSLMNDKVDLAMDKVAGKIITELASITADAIGDYPELADDYVMAIIDKPSGREVRVYSRQELIESGDKTDEEKKAMAEQLAKEPLVAFSSDEGLPPPSESAGSLALANKVNQFLKINAKLLDNLDKYGFNPFKALMGSNLV